MNIVIELQTEKQTQANIIFCKNKNNFHCTLCPLAKTQSIHLPLDHIHLDQTLEPVNIHIHVCTHPCLTFISFNLHLSLHCIHNHAFLKE